MPSEIPLGFNPRTMIPFNVVIADHSTTERKILLQILKSADFNIIGECENGEDTIKKIITLGEQVDILCIEYRMPDMTALQVIQKVRTLFPKLIIILINDSAEKEIVAEAVKLKINAFLVKPISKVSIYEKFTSLLKRKDLGDKMVVGYKAVGVNLSEIQIPPLQDVMNRVISFDSNRIGGSHELEAIISPDKALCADVLRVANSAYYGRSGSISTLKDAITLIGLDTIKNIVILQFRKNFTKNLTHPLFKKHLIEIPLLTGLIALDLTTPFGLKKLNNQIVISSTLKKVGMSILAQNLKTRYLDLIKIFERGSKSFAQIEREELNTDHIQIGIKVFKLWNMPVALRNVVANQGFAYEEMMRVNDLDRLLRLAEILALKMNGIQTLEEDLKILHDTMSLYNAPDELITLFNDEYYMNIKGHPFFDPI